MGCLLCDFKILLTVFNQNYNCQTSHYLCRNRLPKPLLIFPFLLNLMVLSSLAPKWPMLVPFCGIDYQRCNFYYYLIPFCWRLLRLAYATTYLENLLQISKCHKLKHLKNTWHLWNYKSWYLPEPIYFIHFNVRHPVISRHENASIL